LREKATSWAIRILGALILLLTLTPVYRVLNQPETGRFGGGAILRGDANLETAWWGILVALILGAALSVLLPTQAVRGRLTGLGLRLTAIPTGLFAGLTGAVAATLSLLTALGLFKGLPTLVDGMVALLHGRMIAGATLSVSLPDPQAAWLIANTVLTPSGWISQYPPFPSLLLAAGFLVHAHWMVGPLLVGATVAFSVLLADHLLPQEPLVARLGGLLMALSPFLLFLGGGYLSHLPAAAFGALTLYSALRARDGDWKWAILTGLGSGAMVASRPWLGLMVGVAFPVALWIFGKPGREAMGWIARRLVGATLGGIPFAMGLGWFNQHFFGHPLRLGYSVAFGPSHDLGFHTDPWGNQYGPLQALGFTAQDLLSLGIYLLETPIPAVILVGVFLSIGPRLTGGGKVLLAWASLPVLANVFYWHHGSHLGPRMLYEAAPAWILLSVLAALSLAGSGPSTPEPVQNPTLRDRLRPGNVLLWSLLVCLFGPLFLTLNRARSYQWDQETLVRITTPRLPEGAPPLIFVHGSWSERVSARLQASGMRLDSIESALRRNDLCRVHTYVTLRAVSRGEGEPPSNAALPELDFSLLAETPAPLEPVYITEGNRILIDPREPFSPECRREAQADQGGIISLAPLIWQGDLPGLERGGAMFVRDLGWEDNQTVQAAYPDRTPYVFLIPAPGWDPELREYEEGMRSLWGDEGAETNPGDGGSAPAPLTR